MIVYVVSYEDRFFSGVSYVADDRQMAQDYIDRQTDRDTCHYHISEMVVSRKESGDPSR